MKSASQEPTQEEMKEAAAVKDRHMASLFKLPAVVGAGISVTETKPRKPVIEIYVSRELTEKEREKFPKELEGFEVRIVITGEIRALPEEKDKDEKQKKR